MKRVPLFIKLMVIILILSLSVLAVVLMLRKPSTLDKVINNNLPEVTTEVLEPENSENYEMSENVEDENIVRDPLFDSVEYNSDNVSEDLSNTIDVSVFETEQAKNVVRELATDLHCDTVNMFHSFTDYDAGILTTTYYITFDKDIVYYVYEQGNNAFILKDELHTYSEVLQSLESE